MADVGATYRQTRERITDLVADLGPEAETIPVPTCPHWSVHDVVAHVTGVCADILAGNLDGVTTEAWTHAQVEPRRPRSVEEVVAEWAEVAPQIEAIADSFGPPGRQLVTDLVTHEHDIRLGLDRPGARHSPAVAMAVDYLVAAFGRSLPERGLGPVEVVAGDQRWVVGGEGDAAIRLTGEPFELMRAITGRRSKAQIRALNWSADPAPYLAAFTFGPFTVSPTDVAE